MSVSTKDIFDQTISKAEQNMSTFNASTYPWLLINLSALSLSLSACTIDFDDFEPYTKPGVYAGETVEVDMEVEVDMLEPDMILDVDMDMEPPPPPDQDMDGVADEVDNCPDVPNPEQLDGDMDGKGDACDDDDMDQILDYRADGMGGSVANDNCLGVPNNDQRDSDWDGQGDACDDDLDGDGLNAMQEMELGTDPSIADSDGDGFLDGNDLCPTVPSKGLDNDGDGLGNACDLDDDDDGIYDWADTCPFTADPEQGASPEEALQGRGTACADDFDADGLADADDPCPLLPAVERDSLACQSSLLFTGYDGDVYDFYLGDDYLWVASRGGLSKFALTDSYDLDAYSETKYRSSYGLWSSQTTKLAPLYSQDEAQLSLNGLWVVNGKALSVLRYEGVSGSYSAYEIDLSSYGVSEIYDVASVETGAYVATDYGLYWVGRDSVTNIDVAMLMNPTITQLYHDSANNQLWFAINSSLYNIDLSTPETVVEVATIDGMTGVRKIKKANTNEADQTLIILAEQEVIFFDPSLPVEESIRLPLNAYEVLKRAQGYYFATDQGVVHSAPEQVTSPPAIMALQSAKTRVIIENQSGGIILGSASDMSTNGRTDGLGSTGGIHSGGGLWQHYEIEGQTCILDAYMTESGEAWLATPNGLYKRTPSGVQTLIMEAPIFDIHYYSGYLWVTTNASVYQLDINSDAEPVSFPLPSLTPPFTAVFGAADTIWVGAQDGIASASLDADTNTLNAWQEFIADNEPYLPSGETIRFGYENETFWIAVRGPQGGVARYGVNGFFTTVYSGQNGTLPSSLITDLSVNEQRVIVTTETGVRMFKPVITDPANDIVSLFPGTGIPVEAGTIALLSVVDTGDRLWMYTKPTNDRVYGGLMTLDIDDPNQNFHTEGSERFYDEYDLDVLKSTLPEQVFGDRSRVRLSQSSSSGLLLSTCGDETSPGGLGVLDSSRAIEQHIPTRGLWGNGQGVLVPSPRGHAMFSTAFGDLASAEDGQFGAGYTQTKDLYAPLQESEDWGEGLEPQSFEISSESLPYELQDCRAYQQLGEATKRLTCVLKGAYLARQIANNWITDADPILDDNRLLIKDMLLDPDNPVNTLWLASDRGLINLRTGQETVLTVANTAQKLPSDDIRALAWHPMQRKLYIGTSRGLVVLNAASPLPPELSQVEIEALSDDQIITKGPIYSLHFSEDQTLWIGTSAGVAAYKEEMLTIYPQGSHLPSGPINAIAEQEGQLYFSHPQGVSRYHDGQWTHYGSRDGVSTIKGRFVLDDRGTLWGLGQEGVFAFTATAMP